MLFSRKMFGLMLIGAFVAAFLGAAGFTAKADTDDQLFVTRITEAGFEITGSMSNVITEARAGCILATLTHNPHDVANSIWRNEPQLSFSGVGKVARIAAEVYCPQVLFFADPERPGTSV